jgi:hypothetical protein
VVVQTVRSSSNFSNLPQLGNFYHSLYIGAARRKMISVVLFSSCT